MMVVFGALWWMQPPPDAAWKGPVQCIAISSNHVRVRDAMCGRLPSISERLVIFSRRTKDIWKNCTVCETQVACGADSALPNLVDGTLRALPRNASSQTCMLGGQSFSGYYRSWPGVALQSPQAGVAGGL